jgi:NADH-quinone oxidoreductase subunit N
MLSLAGIPLTAGFIGKFYIIATGVESHLWWLVGALVLGSAIGVFYYLRVMVTLYLIEPNLRRPTPAELGTAHRRRDAAGHRVLAFVLGVYPQPCWKWCSRLACN